MKTKEEISNQIREIALQYSEQKFSPFLTILQPRRNINEIPAQQLQDWKNRMVDMSSVSVSYHAIDGNPVDVARNYLIEKALEDDSIYALFVDEDTALPYYGVQRLIEVSKQFPDAIISGIYYVKFGNPMISIKDEKDRWHIPDVTPKYELIRNVISTGLGCCLLQMRIIKQIRDKFPDLPLFCIVPEGIYGDNLFIGEDTWFFNLARLCGIETIGVPDVQCLHMELATGKYEAHPDIDEEDYITNIPLAGRLTLKDRPRVSKDYFDRICKPNYEGEK